MTTRRPLASLNSSLGVCGSLNISATRCFLCRKQRRALPIERNGKALLWGEVKLHWRAQAVDSAQRAPFLGALNRPVGYQPAQFCAQSFDFRQFLSDAFE